MYNSDALAAVILLSFVLPFIFAIVSYVLSALALTKLFQKAGVSTPAVAWIPVYNMMLWAKLVDLSPWVYLIGTVGVSIVLGWTYIFMLVPFAILVVMILRTNQKLGKEPVGWTIFGGLLTLIWLLVVGFDSSTWRTGEQNGVPAPFWHKWGAFFHDATTFGGVPYQGYPLPQGPAAPPQAPPPAAPPQTPPPAV